MIKFKHLGGKTLTIDRSGVTEHGFVERYPGLGRVKDEEIDGSEARYWIKKEEARGDFVI